MKSKRIFPAVFIKVAVFILLMSLISCSSTEPEPIVYGEDNCAYCNMAIVDQSFGTELVSKKGKKYKFDSIECLAAFNIKGEVPSDDVSDLWVTDNLIPGTLIKSTQAVFVHSETMRSPMGVGLVAFSSKEAAEKSIELSGGTIVDWPGLIGIVNNAWSIQAR